MLRGTEPLSTLLCDGPALEHRPPTPHPPAPSPPTPALPHFLSGSLTNCRARQSDPEKECGGLTCPHSPFPLRVLPVARGNALLLGIRCLQERERAPRCDLSPKQRTWQPGGAEGVNEALPCVGPGWGMAKRCEHSKVHSPCREVTLCLESASVP